MYRKVAGFDLVTYEPGHNLDECRGNLSLQLDARHKNLILYYKYEAHLQIDAKVLTWKDRR